MFSRPKILFLVSLLFVVLLNPKFNPYLPFKLLIFIILVLIDTFLIREVKDVKPYFEVFPEV